MAKTQPKSLSDLLLVEVKAGWTKEKVILKGGVNYPLGAVLSVKSGIHQILAPDAEDGSENAVAVLAEAVNVGADGAAGLVIARGAVVAAEELCWPDDITEPEKAAALAELEARGIVAGAAL